MKRALILIGEGFEDSELIVPRDRLLEAGWKVDVAAPKKGPVSSKFGIGAVANVSIGSIKPESYDLLVLPGGKGPEKVRLEKKALRRLSISSLKTSRSPQSATAPRSSFLQAS